MHIRRLRIRRQGSRLERLRGECLVQSQLGRLSAPLRITSTRALSTSWPLVTGLSKPFATVVANDAPAPDHERSSCAYWIVATTARLGTKRLTSKICGIPFRSISYTLMLAESSPGLSSSPKVTDGEEIIRALPRQAW